MKYLILFILSFSFSAHSLIDLTTGRSKAKYKPKVAKDAYTFRNLRRVGIGGQVLGPLGMAGINLEMNFHPQWSILTGFGGGPGYQSFSVQYKMVLSGNSFVPYGTFGISRWYNYGDAGAIKDSTPALLYENLMSKSDKEKGKINEVLIFPSFGLQYLNLDGDWAGFSMALEVNLLFDIMDFEIAPTIGLGSTYYF